jgi:hypothetical protein
MRLVVAREDQRGTGGPDEEAEEGYSPTARLGASPQSCSSR